MRGARGAPRGEAAAPRCEDSIGCMHGSSEPDLRTVPISRLNLDEYNLLTVHS
ncbi:hypothetical protein L555_0855 [Bordetella pertussis STO1-CHOC-0008]|nr:hypothetical protein L555_0855 [Bordetella pertussis STO1-CHOC-0008]